MADARSTSTKITMPVLNVFAKDDHIIPPKSTQALADRVGTKDYTEIGLAGGHVGVFVSGKSQGILGKRHLRLAARSAIAIGNAGARARRDRRALTPRFADFPALGPAWLPRVAYTEWGPPKMPSARSSACTASRATAATSTSSRGDSPHSGMRVIAPDLPGRGRSDWVAHARRTTRPPLYLAAMAPLIARLGVEQRSTGSARRSAATSAWRWRRARERRSAAWCSMTSARASRRQRCSASAPTCATRRHFETLAEARGAPAHDPRALRPPDRRAVAPPGRAQRRRGRGGRLPPALRSGDRDAQFSRPLMFWTSSLWHVWEKVECPVLILRGEDSDLLLAGDGREMKRAGVAAKQGRVQSVEVADCGHAPALMTDAQISVVEDFLLAEQPSQAEPRRARRAGRPHTMKNKIVTAAEAIAIIRDGDTIAFSGFVGTGTPDELIGALEQRFVETGAPARSDARLRRRARRRQGARAEPPRARGPGQARRRRPLVARAQARRAWRWTTGSRPTTCRWASSAHLFRDIGGASRRHAHQGGPAHVRRSAPGGGKINDAHHRRSRARDADRRRGVALLQGLPDHGGASSAAPPRTSAATSPWSARR